MIHYVFIAIIKKVFYLCRYVKPTNRLLFDCVIAIIFVFIANN